jgi:hypothetical protein
MWGCWRPVGKCGDLAVEEGYVEWRNDVVDDLPRLPER